VASPWRGLRTDDPATDSGRDRMSAEAITITGVGP
jgi:hypothetical protein